MNSGGRGVESAWTRELLGQRLRLVVEVTETALRNWQVAVCTDRSGRSWTEQFERPGSLGRLDSSESSDGDVDNAIGFVGARGVRFVGCRGTAEDQF